MPYKTVKTGNVAINQSECKIQNTPLITRRIAQVSIFPFFASSALIRKYLYPNKIPVVNNATPAKTIIPDVKLTGLIRSNIPTTNSVIHLRTVFLAVA